MECMACKRDAVEDKNKTTFRCDGCKRLLHFACAKVTATEVKCLQLSTRSMKFFCDECEQGMLQIPVLKSLIGDLQTQVGKLEKLYQKSLKEKELQIGALKTEVENLKQQGGANINMEVMFEEVNERFLRSKNFMIYNAPESNSRIIGERIEEDKSVVTEILQLLEVGDLGSNVCKVLRVGRSDGPKSRPIKVVMADNCSVKKILRSKKKMQQTNYRISSDQTKMQQELFKNVKRELKTRQDSGEENIGIRYRNGIPRIETFSDNRKN